MPRTPLLAAALALVLLGAGVVLGTSLATSDAPATPPAPPPLLRAEARPEEPATPAPTLLGQDPAGQVLARLARLEEELAALRAQQAEASTRLAAAGDLVALLEAMRARAERASPTRAAANETAAWATLRNVTSAQAQSQASGKVDTDGDGVGEYAGFREMSGATAGRMAGPLVPPVLSGAFRALNEHGEALRSGYCYRFYLPGPGGEGVGEPREGFTPASGIDADLAETTWCCYAWPAAADAGGTTFFVNQAGDVLTTQDGRYVGPGSGPAPDAAFAGGPGILGPAAVDLRGGDGNVWRVRG